METLRRITVMILITACALLLASCAGGEQLAATVGGQPIYEQDITDAVQQFRDDLGMEDDDAWAQWLDSSGYTTEDVRDIFIDEQAYNIIVTLAAEEQDISISDEDLDAYIAQEKQSLGGDDAFEEMLESSGMTEAEYRETIRVSLLDTALQNAMDTYEPSDTEVMHYANELSESYDGAKRSSQIVFSADDAATAQEVLDRINSGELSFTDAVALYSIDASSKAADGDTGWNVLSSYSSEYEHALADLDEGQISGLVTADDRIYIIMCTQVYTAPETLESLDQLPAEFQEAARSRAQANGSQSAYADWLEEYKENVDVQINPMPDGLPYDVEVTASEN